jgi:hypothetical protein
MMGQDYKDQIPFQDMVTPLNFFGTVKVTNASVLTYAEKTKCAHCEY